MKLTVQQRLVKNHVALRKNKHTVLYSEVIRLGKTTVCKDIPTAGTDGLNVIYTRHMSIWLCGDICLRSTTGKPIYVQIMS